MGFLPILYPVWYIALRQLFCQQNLASRKWWWLQFDTWRYFRGLLEIIMVLHAVLGACAWAAAWRIPFELPGFWVLSQLCFTDTLLNTVLWKGELIRKCIVKLSQYNSVPHCRILLSQHTHTFQKGSGMYSAVLFPEKVWSLKSVQNNGWSEFGYGEDTIMRESTVMPSSSNSENSLWSRFGTLKHLSV